MVDTLQNVHIPNRRTALPPRVRRGPPAGLYPPKHLRPLDGRPRCDRTLPPHHHVAISISIIATVRVVVVGHIQVRLGLRTRAQPDQRTVGHQRVQQVLAGRREGGRKVGFDVLDVGRA